MFVGGKDPAAVAKRTKRRFRVLLASILAVILCALLVGGLGYFYMARLQTTLKESSEGYLDEITYKMCVSTQRSINGHLGVLESIARLLENSSLSAGRAGSLLRQEQAQWGYLHIAMVDEAGNWHMEDGGSEYLEASLLTGGAVVLGEPSILSPVTVGGRACTAYGVPLQNVTVEGRRMVALVSIYSQEAMADMLSLEAFSGAGYAYIIHRDGSLVLNAANDNRTLVGEDLLARLESARMEKDGEYERIRSDLAQGRSGHSSYELDGVQKYLHYVPMGISDWYLITIIPSSAVSESAEVFFEWTALFCVFLTLLFVCLFLVFVTSQFRNRRRLEQMAYLDPVTGGKNRNAFECEASSLLQGKHSYALVYGDIEKFKLINDQLGTQAGDTVLRAVTAAMNSILIDDELVARLSGDHFALLMRYCSMTRLEQRLVEAQEKISQLLEQEDIRYQIGFSYGVYLPEKDDSSIPTMLGRANLARQSDARPRGGITYGVYDSAFRNRLLREKKLEDKLLPALQQGHFIVYLQPKYQLPGQELAGAEALARWMDPEEGMISPAEFIPLMERNGHVTYLDLNIFEQVCAALRRWIGKGLAVVPISVNLSRRHLAEEAFWEKFERILKQYGVPPALIEFEFTETLIYQDRKRLATAIEEIHRMGCSCSIDDFGSGYSSLNLLKDVDVDVLKLDKAFFDDQTATNPRGGEIILGVLSMARRLKLRTVAEGVEREDQVEFLKKAKCDLVQGFVFDRPMPLEEYEKRLRPLAAAEASGGVSQGKKP